MANKDIQFVLRREETLALALDYKRQGLDNHSIAQKLYDDHGIGFVRQGEVIRKYSGGHIYNLLKEKIVKLQEQNLDGAKEFAIILELRYEKLYEAWEEKSHTDLRAAEFCRKALADLATLKGANAPVEAIVTMRIEKSFESLIPVLRAKLSDSEFINVVEALSSAQTELYQHYSLENQERKALEAGDVIEGEVIEED